MSDASPVPPQISRLLEHLEWADARASRALLQADDPPEDALKFFAHVLGSEERWLSRMEGREPQLDVWPELDPHACARQAAANAEGIRRFVSSLTEGDLGRIIRYTVSTGDPYESRIDDILLHMCLHGAYHRGQVALLLRRGGDVPIPTDFIVFARE